VGESTRQRGVARFLVDTLRLTIEADPSCGLNGLVAETEITNEDVADWVPDCSTGCESDDPEHCDSLDFELRCVDGAYELQLHLKSKIDPVEQKCCGTCVECTCNPMEAVFTFACDFCGGNLTVTVEEVEDGGVRKVSEMKP
jgi:hypothetical protein